MFVSSFFGEASNAMGKSAMKNRIQSIYSYGFLGIFYFTVFMIVAVWMGADFRFSTDSLPYLVPRIILEVVLASLGVRAVKQADMSTFAFLRLISIPLLLVVDIILGYPVSAMQMLGITLLFGTLVYLMGHRSLNPGGSKLLIAIALIGPINLSLYKYDISHYNSVAAEQIIVGLCLMVFFTAAAWYSGKEKTWGYLFKKRPEEQSLLSGLGGVAGSYAYTYAPASIVLTFSRATEIFFSIIFGSMVFHEKRIGNKFVGLVVIVVGLLLIALS